MKESPLSDRDAIRLIIDKGALPERRLKIIPVLKTCDNWKKVLPLALVDHAGALVHLRGGLVELDGKLYFVRRETMAAIRGDINWAFPRVLKVL